MTISPETRDLARHLLACEAVADKTSAGMESAALRVYEKLRRRLCVFAGVAGFQSLASRALVLARSDDPGLSAVQVAADGSLQGLTEFDPQIRTDENRTVEGEVILIARLLGLLLLFLGEALTSRLVSDVWPDATFDDRNSGDRRKA